jgi:hypothetical protein
MHAANVLGAECKSPPAVMASNRMSPRALGCDPAKAADLVRIQSRR